MPALKYLSLYQGVGQATTAVSAAIARGKPILPVSFCPMCGRAVPNHDTSCEYLVNLSISALLP